MPIFLSALIGVYLLQYSFNLYKRNKIESKIDTINLTIVLIFLTIVLIWYIYNNNSSVFISILGIFNGIYSSILTSFLSPNSTQGLTIIGMKVTFFNSITKYLYLFTQFLIVIGIIGFLFNIGNINKRFKMKKGYFFFAIIFLGICIISILVPKFSSQLDTVRMFHITIIVLSPFFVVGFKLIMDKIYLLIKSNKSLKTFNIISIIDKISLLIKSNRSFHKTFNIISIFLIVFLILNTGLVQEIVKEPYKPTMALSSSTNPPVFNEKDTSSAEWLNGYKNNESFIYSDINGFVLLGGFVGPKSILLSYSLDTNRFNDLSNNSYIYLISSTNNGTLNIVQDSVNGSREGFIDQKLLNPITRGKNRIYDNNVIILF